MRAMGLPKSRYITEPRRTSKDGLMRILEGMPEEHKIAWVTTDARSFEWSEINGRREGFLEDMRGIDFRELAEPRAVRARRVPAAPPGHVAGGDEIPRSGHRVARARAAAYTIASSSSS